MTNVAKKFEMANQSRMQVAHNAYNKASKAVRAWNDDRVVAVKDCDLMNGVYHVNYVFHGAFDRSKPEMLSIEVSEVKFKQWIIANKANQWDALRVSAVTGEAEAYEVVANDIDAFLFEYNSVMENYQIMKEYLESEVVS